MSIIYKSIVSKYFEDFSIGDKYVLPSRTHTSAIFSMFLGDLSQTKSMEKKEDSIKIMMQTMNASGSSNT